MSETLASMKKPLTVACDRAALLCIDLQEEHRQDRRLLAVGFEGVIANVRRLQDAARRERIPVYHFAYIVDIASSLPHHPKLPDGRSAFVTLAADETMGVIDLEARKLTRKVKVEKSPDGVWFGPTPK